MQTRDYCSPSPLARMAELVVSTRRAVLQRCAPLALFVLSLCALPAQASLVPPQTERGLTTIRAVHALRADEAAKHPPVRLRGVVTSGSTWPNTFFLQDATGGIAVGNETAVSVRSGEAIEVEARAWPGLFAPVIHVSAIRPLGKAPMPRVRVFASDELMGGKEDSNWIAVRGVVHSARITTSHGTPVLSATVLVNANPITVEMLDYAPTDVDRLVDATVLIHGVCTTSFNDKKQFTGVGMQVPAMAYVRVEQAAPVDSYAKQPISVRSLMQFTPDGRYEHRVQVVGTVTYQDPGHSLYLQDGTDGVLITTDQATPVTLGTKIKALGFASAGVYSPVLRDGSFRVAGGGVTVVPAVSVRTEDLLRRGYFVTAPYEAQLVRLRAQLVETASRLNDVTWVLRDGDIQLTAVLQRPFGTPDPAFVESGSVVEVTGVFTTQLDEDHQPTSFRVLLRGADDIAVIRHAPWWNTGHAVGMLATVFAIALATTLWGATLRRTVRQQTQMLRESEERFRKQAQHDALTGLVSRSFLHDQLRETIRAVRFSGEKFGLLMIDLDFFKQVNDTLGHHAGDELLCVVAGRLRAAVRKTDIVARMGGDEFVVLLSNLSGLDEAEEIGGKVVSSISALAEIAGQPMLISASVGVCLYPDGGKDVDTLLQNVDTAMYKAKAAGRNSFSIYTADRPERKIVGKPVLSHTS